MADPIYWSNYPEAQNPKSYLNSFGDLPKVMPSPDPRNSTVKEKDSQFRKKAKKSSIKIGRKISQSLGMTSKKHKTLSRTSLTRDFSEEIHSVGSTSSLSSTSSGERPTHPEQNSVHLKVTTNGVAINNSNQSIITIENVGHIDRNEEEVLTTNDSIDKDCNHSSDQMSDGSDIQSVDNNNQVIKEQNKEKNGLVLNVILPDECTDSIELCEIGDRNGQNKENRYITDDEIESYSDLWNSIRSAKKS